MVKKVFASLLILMLAFIAIGCSTEADPPVQPDVYVAGQLDGQAVLWVNGEAISLEIATGTDESEAIGMYYYGGNLFIIGNEKDDDGYPTGVYWAYNGTDDPVRYELTGDNDTKASGLDGLSGTLYISGYDFDDNSTPDNYDDDSSDAVYWIVSGDDNQQQEALKQGGEYYTKDIVLDGGMVPQILGFTPNQSHQIAKWDDDGGWVSMKTYTGLNPYSTMNIEVDETGDLNIMGNLSGDIMLWKEQQVRSDDTDPFEKITIYDGTHPDTGEALAFDAEGNAVIVGQVWVSNQPYAKCWVYDGVSTETIDLGEGLAKDVQIGENGSMYIAGYTYDWEACYWTVDSQGTVTQEILDTRESPDSYAYAILIQ